MIILMMNLRIPMMEQMFTLAVVTQLSYEISWIHCIHCVTAESLISKPRKCHFYPSKRNSLTFLSFYCDIFQTLSDGYRM